MLKAPKCQWPECRREMFLLNEGPDFWFFACECGCTRALSKPSGRDKSLHAVMERDIAQIKERQRILGNRKAYSFSSKESHANH